MNAEEILTQVRSGSDLPEGWVVFPLLRTKAILGIIGWLLGVLMGLGLFALMASVVIPSNYERGLLAAVFTTVLLGIFLFIGLGSTYLVIHDVLRVRDASRHLIVITVEDFVKQEGQKIVHVPLRDVLHVTARGVAPVDRSPNSEREAGVGGVPRAGEHMTSFLFGRGTTSAGQRWMRRRKRTPTSLMFVDARTDKDITVVSDTVYGDHFAIAAVLKQYAASAQRSVV